MEKLRFVIDEFSGRRVLILGFGREGRSTFRLLQTLLPGQHLLVADRDEELGNTMPELQQESVTYFGGSDYLNSLRQADVIIRSPGIPFLWLPDDIPYYKYTSQTELFLRAYRNQVSGITGTKGKSTTTALLHHLLVTAGLKAVKAGNIGIPPFTILDQIDDETRVVLELSCHQLHRLRIAPATSILLNLFQEHLDQYRDLDEYHLAKFTIASRQETSDTLIYHGEDTAIARLRKRVPARGKAICFSLAAREDAAAYWQEDSIILQVNGGQHSLHDVLRVSPLPGEHNMLNLLAASLAAFLQGATPDDIVRGIRTFEPLEHRLEYVGEYGGIRFYNDSISTIPEATIMAVSSLPEVHTLILGGTDRGIDYSPLARFLPGSGVGLVICTGDAGKRINKLFCSEGTPPFRIVTAGDYEEVVALAFRLTPMGKTCLLSPAAASYDWFSNFEERGSTFKTLVRNHSRQ